MGLERIKQIKLCWKKYDKGDNLLSELFKAVEKECNATSQEVVDAIHFDLTGKILGVIL